jgi:hypothetical protein
LAIISHLTSFSASNQVCVPHFYRQIMVLILIPQYSPQNTSKSLHKTTFDKKIYGTQQSKSETMSFLYMCERNVSEFYEYLQSEISQLKSY